ncbi:MAG: ABC transporter permease [Chlorobi bacterium]|nr:ABC transporter permease [Chlorobiota bacterium]MCI0715351.1 ABC transporter permease [Chlorobiota bacterium]
MNLIINFIKKEFLQFKRDKRMFGVILIAPVLQLIFLGYAATLDVKNVKTAVWDQDKSVTSREFIEKYEKSGYFEMVYYTSSYNELNELIDNGEVLMAIVIPRDFEKNIYSGKTTGLQTIFDGTDGNKALIAAGYSIGITTSFAGNVMNDFIERLGGKNSPLTKIPAIEAETRVWYNPNLATRNYMLPGIVGLLIMIITINLTSMAIVKEKEIGTFEQLIVTPLKPYQIIIGKLVPFSILGFVTITIVITVMRLWFGIEVRGSVVFLYLGAFLFMLSTLGLGLFVSTISRTQQQATMTSFFGVMMPMIYLSGFAFPIENMPQWIQYITYIIPLRYFITIVRGIILKGIGIENLYNEYLALLVFGAVILALSSLRFRKKLE